MPNPNEAPRGEDDRLESLNAHAARTQTPRIERVALSRHDPLWIGSWQWRANSYPIANPQ